MAFLLGSLQAQNARILLIDPANELPEVFNGQQIVQLVGAVDRGLVSLQKLQEKDGSFSTIEIGKPAITALAVMVYLSRGHLSGEDPYGELLEKAIIPFDEKRNLPSLIAHYQQKPKLAINLIFHACPLI